MPVTGFVNIAVLFVCLYEVVMYASVCTLCVKKELAARFVGMAVTICKDIELV